LPYGVEGFATPKHLVKEDGSQAQIDEKLSFKVIEFNKDAKRIILSHSRIHEDVKRTEKTAAPETAGEAPKKVVRKSKKEETTSNQSVEKTTLGDIQSLADLKDQLVNAAAEKMVKAEKAKKAAKVKEEEKVEEKAEVTEAAPKKSTKKAKTEEAAEEVAEA
jgi:small subunit ribosomal protein S1